MQLNLVQKIIKAHLVTQSSGGELPKAGEAIAIQVDQTLTQDSTGTMVYLQLEAMGISKLATEVSVAYIDHNLLQSGFENADDHAFIESVAKKYGIVFSKPGNGICHQLHLENFAASGKTLIGSDSHTPTCGAMGMLAIGAGGLDVALGMATGVYHLAMPRVIGVVLKGRRRPWVSAKDVALKVLQILGVSGGLGAVLEYIGEGTQDLSLTERATITNMGAEVGATSSVFSSDEMTKAYLLQVGRSEAYKPMKADEGALYDEILTIDLGCLEPMVAKPHSPDHVAMIRELETIQVDQVAIGSCTNASYSDLMKVAKILEGKQVAAHVSLVISPGSSAILKALAENGALASMIASGARILEAGCGPCIGMGQSPKTNAVSVRTFNRNFKGRSGTASAQVYLVSPEMAALTAISGYIGTGGKAVLENWSDLLNIEIDEPTHLDRLSSYWVKGASNLKTPIVMGPNIKAFPVGEGVPNQLSLPVSLVTGDGISTDDIMPSHAGLLPFRSNIPKLSQHCFEGLDADFSSRASHMGRSAIVGGETYGQGSSREHAALVPLYLGVRAVIAKSFARIHRANLINSGIIPLTFVNPLDAEKLSIGSQLQLENLHEGISTGNVVAKVGAMTIALNFTGSQREKRILLSGGALNDAREAMANV